MIRQLYNQSIAVLRMSKKSIYELCRGIGHKTDACIIRGANFLPPSLRGKMNKFNALRGNEPTKPPRERNSQPPPAHLKSRTSPPKTSPVVLAIMVRLNIHAIDNGDVEVHPSDFPF